MKSLISECCVVLFILAAADGVGPVSFADALSGHGKNGVSRKQLHEESKPPATSTVYLGGDDKEIEIFVPSKKNKSRFESAYDGSGSSEFALSQLIAHCPSLVNERNVLELSSGLGMVSAVACKYSKPNHVAITDRDKSLLSLAYASCVQLQRSSASVSRCCMDWNKPSTWPRQEYDMLLAADVLCDKPSILPLVDVIKYYLCEQAKDDTKKQAVIVDPVNQVNRRTFCYAARRAGLNVDQKEFPGSPDLILMSISPSF